jgi:hypothetical protein
MLSGSEAALGTGQNKTAADTATERDRESDDIVGRFSFKNSV